MNAEKIVALDMQSFLRSCSGISKWIIFISSIIGLLAFTSTIYMLEVYGRVIASRNIDTLIMISIAALGAYILMEMLENFRSQVFWNLGLQFEIKMVDRIYNAMFDALLQKQTNNGLLVQHDFRIIREFFNNPALAAIFDIPMALLAMALIFLINPLLGWAALCGVFLQTTVAWLIQYDVPPDLSSG